MTQSHLASAWIRCSRSTPSRRWLVTKLIDFVWCELVTRVGKVQTRCSGTLKKIARRIALRTPNVERCVDGVWRSFLTRKASKRPSRRVCVRTTPTTVAIDGGIVFAMGSGIFVFLFFYFCIFVFFYFLFFYFANYQVLCHRPGADLSIKATITAAGRRLLSLACMPACLPACLPPQQCPP